MQSYDVSKVVKNSNYFRHAHKGDFPKFGHILFSNATALVRLLLFVLAGAILYEKPYYILLQIYFLAYTSLFSIKSNVLNQAKKVYSVNKGLFLGVFSLSWFAYMGGYRDVIYRPLC